MNLKTTNFSRESTRHWRTVTEVYTVALERYDDEDGVQKYVTSVLHVNNRRRRSGNRIVHVSNVTDNNIVALADYTALVSKHRKEGWQVEEKAG